MIQNRVLNNIIYRRNIDKDVWIRKVRWFGFDDVCDAIESWNILDDIKHPNQEKYKHQYKLIVKLNNYARDVPYIKECDTIYLFKTAMPSRKSTKQYIL